MEKVNRKTVFTTIAIDTETNKLVEKICKRYSLKKGEIVKLTFQYIDKASINPTEAPESVKSELAKINKRQDDIIRFIRHYEENELNPMIRASSSIAIKFEGVVKILSEAIDKEITASRELQENALKKINEAFNQHATVINNQGKLIGSMQQTQKRDNAKLLKIITLYADLASCGVMDGKRKENIKAEITNLINETQ